MAVAKLPSLLFSDVTGSLRSSVALRSISSTSIWSRPSTEDHGSQPTEDQDACEHKIAVERPHSCIDQAIRVNYAGELAAARMYAGRAAVVGKSPKLEQMEKRERGHAEVFKKLMAERRVRPSLTLPLWDLGGFALGSLSALLSEDVARVCSEAVEDVVNDHYNKLDYDSDVQLREFISNDLEDDELLKGIVKCRDDDVGAELGSYEEEQTHESLRQVVKSGCELAIWVTETI